MAEPIRVAQVLNRMDSGGIESVVMNYYRHIDREKVQFDFYLAEGSSFPQREELERLGAGIFPIPPYSRPIRYHRVLYKAFKERRYKIVHAHLSTMSVFPLFAAWRAGVPVRICHNHTTAYWGEGIKTLLKYILRPFNKIFATDYFACGETAGRWMFGNRCFDSGRVTVMPNAIDAEKFAFDPEERIALREELGIPQDAFVVGHVGRFTYAKNHSFLLDIFYELLKTRPDARLLLIGGGELESRIRSKAKRLGIEKSVIFAGVRADVNRLYNVMDAFCLPSLYEGLGMAAWEAQANSLPVLLSDKVPQEAALSENCRHLPLEAGAAAWAAALLEGRRMKAADVPNIRESEKWLEEKYISLTTM